MPPHAALLLLSLPAAAADLPVLMEGREAGDRTAFAAFEARFGRRYNGSDERAARYAVFRQNLADIAAGNAAKRGYSLGVGPFADWTAEEFRARRTGGYRGPRPRRGNATAVLPPAGATPDSVDWVAKGAVTAVQDQGDCGDCWAFSATGALEGALAAAGKGLTKLSEQMLVDCDTYADGCNSGGADLGLWWVEDHGLSSEADYPYNSGKSGKKGSCKKGAPLSVAKGALADYSDVDESESALQAAVSRHPVSIAIQANEAAFQHYKGGVLTGACGTDLDHNVLAVGYGVLDGAKYWKVKNSWGPKWGMDGYVLIERGVSQKDGLCGILKDAIVPVLKN